MGTYGPVSHICELSGYECACIWGGVRGVLGLLILHTLLVKLNMKMKVSGEKESVCVRVCLCVYVCVCVYDSQMETLCDRVFIGDNVLTIGSTEVS